MSNKVPLSSKATQVEVDVIDVAAALKGCKRATFIREASLKEAKRIIDESQHQAIAPPPEEEDEATKALREYSRRGSTVLSTRMAAQMSSQEEQNASEAESEEVYEDHEVDGTPRDIMPKSSGLGADCVNVHYGKPTKCPACGATKNELGDSDIFIMQAPGKQQGSWSCYNCGETGMWSNKQEDANRA